MEDSSATEDSLVSAVEEVSSEEPVSTSPKPSLLTIRPASLVELQVAVDLVAVQLGQVGLPIRVIVGVAVAHNELHGSAADVAVQVGLDVRRTRWRSQGR